MFDLAELVKRAIKYLVEGLMVAIAAYAIPQKRLKIDATIHGMRSSFKDWASEKTNFNNEVSEMALAHSIINKVEASYRRGNLLEKRRALMNQWEHFLYKKNIKIFTIKTKKRSNAFLSNT